MNLYIPNTLIDASYTLTGLLFGLSAYLRSIRSVKINKFKNDDAELPFNYGNHSNSYLIILLPFLSIYSYLLYTELLNISSTEKQEKEQLDTSNIILPTLPT